MVFKPAYKMLLQCLQTVEIVEMTYFVSHFLTNKDSVVYWSFIGNKKRNNLIRGLALEWDWEFGVEFGVEGRGQGVVSGGVVIEVKGHS